MANGKIRGITIEIGADVSGLQKSLSGINSSISSTQKQLKDVEKLLKLDPTNTELLEQKQRLLNKSVEEYSEKLKTLKSEQQKFADAAASGNEEAQKSYDALQREIISVQESLEKAQKESDNFSVGLSKVSSAMDAVSEKAELVAEKTKAMSAVAAGVVTGIGTMAYKAMTAADDLNTLAQQSGLTTEELQKFEYASDMVDVSTDTIVSALRKMKKNMASTSEDTQDLWRQLGVSVTDANNELRDSSDVFYEVLGALSQVGNETERDTLAMEVFGKSADDLAGIIDDGGQSLREYGEAAEEAGLIWTQESIDAANAVNDMIDVLKADISQTILITGAKALEALTPLIEDVVDIISRVLEWIGSLDSETIKLIATIATIVALISPVASIVSAITSAVSTLTALLPTLLAAAPWIALIALVAQLAYEIWSWVENWDMMSAYFQKGIDKLKNAFQTFGDFLANLFQPIQTFIDSILEGINSIISALKNLFSTESSSNKGSGVIGTGSLIGLAGGGTVSSGSALVGEAGPEILTVAGGQATVTPLSNTTNNTYNQLSTNPIQVSLNLDRMTLARQLVKPMNYLNNLQGASNVK